jgi:hypothetical protein
VIVRKKNAFPFHEFLLRARLGWVVSTMTGSLFGDEQLSASGDLTEEIFPQACNALL